MKRKFLIVLSYFIVAILIISNIFCIVKVIQLDNDLDSLKNQGSYFKDTKQIISFIEKRISSLWEFIALQQKQIELNEQSIKDINNKVGRITASPTINYPESKRSSF